MIKQNYPRALASYKRSGVNATAALSLKGYSRAKLTFLLTTDSRGKGPGIPVLHVLINTFRGYGLVSQSLNTGW